MIFSHGKIVYMERFCVRCGHGFTGLGMKSIPNVEGKCGWCEDKEIALFNQTHKRK